ncbi:MAG: protein phosphatase CheZ [SAR324 cluster bacterium]|nr:protein phosphatase CheZ [SAR324 cluster bacterium]
MQQGQPGAENPQGQDTRNSRQNLVVISKADLLGTLQEIRGILDGYGMLLEKFSESDEWNKRALEMVRNHRARYQNGDSPLAKLHIVSGLFQYMLKRVSQEQFKFSIPTRIGLIPEMESKELAEFSAQLKAMNMATENLVGQAAVLANSEQMRSQEKLRGLLLCITSFFKALLRQDWEDADLFMTHINLITTTQDSEQLVAQVAKIARNIYDSLNEFSNSFPIETIAQSTEALPDAVQKLNSVIARLEEAANTNLDTLERLIGQLTEHKKWIKESQDTVVECEQDLDSLQAENPEMAEDLKSIQTVLRDKIGGNLAELEMRVEENNQTYLAMISNQSFQDLTGQTLRKVIAFIEAMQFKLVELLPNYDQYKAKQQDQATGEESTEGKEDTSNVTIQSQENVDQLLADLGF